MAVMASTIGGVGDGSGSGGGGGDGDGALMPPPPPRSPSTSTWSKKRQRTTAEGGAVERNDGDQVTADSGVFRGGGVASQESSGLLRGGGAGGYGTAASAEDGRSAATALQLPAAAAPAGPTDPTMPTTTTTTTTTEDSTQQQQQQQPQQPYASREQAFVPGGTCTGNVTGIVPTCLLDGVGNHQCLGSINDGVNNRCDGGGREDDEEDDDQDGTYYEIPKTTFADIIGHGQAKLRLDEALLPLALPPELADSVLTGVRAAPATILLHGPPGCGKTQLARAVAGESSSPLISVGPSDVLSKFVGESERSIRSLFERARSEASRSDSRCAVLFFDEIDSLGGARGGMDGGFGGSSAPDGGGDAPSTVGGDGSSRRLLAELLIQLTKNFNETDDEDDDDEDDGDEYDAASVPSANHGSNGRAEETRVDQANGGQQQHQQQGSSPSDRPRAISPVPPTSSTVESANNARLPPSDVDTSQESRRGRQRKPRIRIIVIAATNRPEDCDPALLRRFAVRVLVGPPTRRDRKRILSKFLSDVEHRIGPAQLDELAGVTEGWSGSELESLSREAVMAPVRDCLRAAALLRAKARKREQQSGADSNQDSRKPANHFEVARDALIGGFRSLRPVALEDFEAAMTFCLSGDVGLAHTQNGPFAFGQRVTGAHYDSDSSSDEEEGGY